MRMLLWGYKLLRILLLPFLRWVLPFCNSKAREQINFEQEIIYDYSKIENADFHFEISSEGELEQVYYPLVQLLNKNKKIVLFFCSQSVEHKIKLLQNEFSKNLYCCPVPLLGYSPLKKTYYSHGATLVMCRYDFFPEIVFEKSYKNKILLSGSLRNFQDKNWISKLYLSTCYNQFQKVIAATNVDGEKFESIIKSKDHHIQVFDFRTMSIAKRIDEREKKLKEKFPLFLNAFVPFFSNQKLIIFGSFWKNEIEAFDKSKLEKLKENSHVIVPHQLGTHQIEELKADFSKIGIQTLEINQNTTEQMLTSMLDRFKKAPSVWLFNLKGVLCELYPYFDYAYVGGGFGKSVHSVLEPFMANCKVYLGPVNHRSSELLAIQSIDGEKVKVVNELGELLSQIYGSMDLSSEKSIDLEKDFRLKCRKTMEFLEFLEF